MRDGRALQAGTSHYMGTNFAKAFDIRYPAESGELELCHTTSWGMSTRMIGGGDHDPRRRQGPGAAAAAGALPGGDRADRPRRPGRAGAPAGHGAGRPAARGGIRTHVDDRPQLSPGFKFNDWETARRAAAARARPPRPRRRHRADVDPARRGARHAVPLDSRAGPARNASWTRSRPCCCTGRPSSATRTPARWTRGPSSPTRSPTGWALALHCGRPDCEDDIKAETAATPRCIPAGGPAEEGTCIRCDRRPRTASGSSSAGRTSRPGARNRARGQAGLSTTAQLGRIIGMTLRRR